MFLSSRLLPDGREVEFVAPVTDPLFNSHSQLPATVVAEVSFREPDVTNKWRGFWECHEVGQVLVSDPKNGAVQADIAMLLDEGELAELKALAVLHMYRAIQGA